MRQSDVVVSVRTVPIGYDIERLAPSWHCGMQWDVYKMRLTEGSVSPEARLVSSVAGPYFQFILLLILLRLRTFQEHTPATIALPASMRSLLWGFITKTESRNNPFLPEVGLFTRRGKVANIGHYLE